MIPLTKIAIGFLSVTLAPQVSAQASPSAVPAAPAIDKLPPPSYPAIALAARVWGPVGLNVVVRPDGTVAAAEAVAGPPMLREAAVASAKETVFDCRACSTGPIHFSFEFEYALNIQSGCEPADPSYPRVSESADGVTFTGLAFGTCDPAVSVEKVRARSAKCLYIWKCGWR
jgi:hypothetical protein